MKKWILSCALATSSLIGYGQIFVSEGVEMAINQALHKDVELRNQSLEQKKMALEHKAVLQKYIPRVEANALYGYLHSQANLDLPPLKLPLTGLTLFNGSADFSAEGQAFHGGITAKMVLFSGGQIPNGAKALQEKNQGQIYMMALRKDEVLQDLLQSFDQLELLKTAEALINDSDKRLAKEAERVQKAIALGLAIPYDRDKIKLARLELETKRSDVHNKQQLLALKINQLTGLETDEILSIQHQVTPIVILSTLDTENRNEIKALESFQKASEYAIKKEKGAYLPTLGAFAGYSYSSLFNAETQVPIGALNTTAHLKMNHLTLHPSFMVGVAMKWEIFSGFERQHKVEEAELNAQQIANKLADAKEKMKLQLLKNQAEYETMLHQIDIAEQREKIAQNNNILAEKQYRNGLIGITERLAAENDTYKEALNKMETIINERKAAIETYKAAGILQESINSTL